MEQQMTTFYDNNGYIYMAIKVLKSTREATYSHSINTANVAVEIGSKITHRRYFTLEILKNAGLFHDIGKLFVPVKILNKSGILTMQEKEKVLPHPVWGEEILLSSTDHRVRNLARSVREHHELPDGNGYPSKLTLDDIGPISRVINIADRFAAMTENRSYQDARIAEFALESLKTDIKAFFGSDAEKVVDALAGFRVGAVPRQTHDNTTVLPPATAFFQPELAMAG
jgi:polar amino acid transport system substrate-binding protein